MTLCFSLLLILFSCLSEILFLRQRSRENHSLALAFKCLASLCFCALGLFLSLKAGTFFGFWVLAGLTMGFLGDLLLGLRKLMPRRETLCFILGALSFCVGHGFYITALSIQDASIFLPALPVFLLLTGGSEIFSRYAGFHKGKLHLPGMLYIAAEAFMCGCALMLFFNHPSVGSLLFSLGGLSFLVSDNLLCAFSFGRLHNARTDWLLHGTYLAAQLLIALSILFF